jgi:hypothetical protein
MTRKKTSGPIVVSLYDVVAEMDLPSDDWTAYLNRRTGELVTVTDEEQRIAEADQEPDDLPDWQMETLPKVREVLETEDFLPLPSKFEIHEYWIMERFCLGVEDVEARGELLQANREGGLI